MVFVVDMQKRLRQVLERKQKSEPRKREAVSRKQAVEVRKQTIGEKTKQKANQILLVLIVKN